MKRVMVCIVIVSLASVCSAQTFAEWFRQKKTQIRYLTEQIAGLRAYGEVVNKGYAIAKERLGHISQSKGDDYNQHDAYFLSLANVKSVLKGHPEVRSIINLQNDVAKIYHGLLRQDDVLLTADEKNYISDVSNNLVRRSENILQELAIVIGDRSLEMNDDERIQRIETNYVQMLDCKTFAQGFADRTKLLIAARKKEKLAIEKMKQSYGR